MVVDAHAWIKVMIASVLLMAAVLLAGCSDDNAPLLKGQAAPGFSLPDLQGHTINVPGDFEDKVIVISFWADWCPSCKKEMRDLEAIYQKYREQRLVILAINIAQERDQAIAFIDDLNLSYPILLDSKGKATKTYAVSSIPSIFIIDRKGRLQTRILGEAPRRFLEEAVQRQL
ncbi:MAG TPA: TlpA family protein disulfide reductase [Thiolapillus brandeum]|uniref:TlpA family protein disulfide reductase n=1 Tax=Thiolapillus brandeum TaxID=1076588 RepID=A0A831K3K4_9GAMM|nr:TlpA family protein disulfide reductase [Thiolapillus brandeum]